MLSLTWSYYIYVKIFTQDEAVSEVVEFMNSYSLSQEDFDTIMELAKFKVYTILFSIGYIIATTATINLH